MTLRPTTAVLHGAAGALRGAGMCAWHADHTYVLPVAMFGLFGLKQNSGTTIKRLSRRLGRPST